VEVDGGQHNEQVVYDSERNEWLERQGFRIMRFWNNQVLKEIDAVKERIMEGLSSDFFAPHLNPPPQGGRRS
jgi:very-short-patch-repair endonuclease